jgi:hypothetical protein
METRIKREPFLHPESIRSRSSGRRKNQVPTMSRDNAWNQNELVSSEQRVSKSLLASAGNPGPQPIGIRNGRRIHDMYACQLGYGCRCKDVLDYIKCLETFVNCNLKNCGRGIC